MITLRLDQRLEARVNSTAKNLGLTRSEFIRKSINEYLNQLEQPNAWVAGEDLFGHYSSGRGNLSADRKSLVKDIIKAKRT